MMLNLPKGSLTLEDWGEELIEEINWKTYETMMNNDYNERERSYNIKYTRLVLNVAYRIPSTQ